MGIPTETTTDGIWYLDNAGSLEDQAALFRAGRRLSNTQHVALLPAEKTRRPLSQRQAALRKKIGERRIRAAVRNGELRASKPGTRTVYIDPDELDRWWKETLRTKTWRG